MRVAAIYDIHGNLPALEAVLDEINNEDVDAIVVGGDVVAGPMPVETMTLLQSITRPIYFIQGNVESALLRHMAGEDNESLSEQAKAGMRWLGKSLNSDHIQFISSWKSTLQLEIDGLGQVLFCHATPYNDTDVFTRLTPEERLLPIFSSVTASVVVCGHTHMQFERTIGHVRVVNAGSVGMPYGKTGADWVSLDRNIHFKHTDYDRGAAAERIRQTDYPQAEDFAANNVLQAPSESEALEFFT